MEKYGFVYIWRDRGKDRYYIGAHWGTEDDGYICSSNWMRNSYRRRPQDFKRKILFRCNNQQMLFDKEYYWLRLIPEHLLGKVYYNFAIFNMNEKGTGHVHSEQTKEKLRQANLGKKASDETKKRMSDSMIGKNKGKPGRRTKVSEETKEKMRQAALGRIMTIEQKEKLRQAHLGKKLSTSHVEKISKSNTGKKRSEAIKQKMKENHWTKQKKTLLSMQQ